MLPFTTLQQVANQGDKFWFLCATADDGYSCDRMVEDITDVLKSQNEISPTDPQAVSSFTIAKQFDSFETLFTGINGGCCVMTGTEAHFRVNDNLVFDVFNRGVEPGSH